MVIILDVTSVCVCQIKFIIKIMFFDKFFFLSLVSHVHVCMYEDYSIVELLE